jgi:hypothetical protein
VQKIDLKLAVDPITRETSFELGGVVRLLSFDFPAVYEFYRQFGVNPILEPVGTDPARIASLIYLGLLRHQPEMTDTPEKVKGWFDSGPMFAALTELAFSALRAQKPDPDPEAPAAPADPPSA